MKVTQMTSNRGNTIANQFIVSGATLSIGDDVYSGEVFQSYNSVIALKAYRKEGSTEPRKVFLDERYWDYSATTRKYRGQFLGEGIAETHKKIESGEYILADLNGGELS